MASPRPSPVGREKKHLKSAVTLKLSPSKFKHQNSTFPKPLPLNDGMRRRKRRRKRRRMRRKQNIICTIIL